MERDAVNVLREQHAPSVWPPVLQGASTALFAVAASHHNPTGEQKKMVLEANKFNLPLTDAPVSLTSKI